MKNYFTCLLFMISTIIFCQNIDEKRDLLIQKLCNILSKNKNLDDLARINLVNQDANLIKYFKDLPKDKIEAEEEALFYRFQKNCKEYADLIKNYSEKNLKITTVEDIEIFKALLNAKNDEWIK